MDLERLPSGHFKTNALVLPLGMSSYNILRLCGQESLREDNGEGSREHYRFINIVAGSLRVWVSLRLLVLYLMNRSCFFNKPVMLPGSPAYRRKADRRRIRTVMQDLIYIASHVTRKGRQWFLSFGKYCAWSNVWKSIYRSFKEPIGACSRRLITIIV
jgi:hypothetical protein